MFIITKLKGMCVALLLFYSIWCWIFLYSQELSCKTNKKTVADQVNVGLLERLLLP